MDDPLEEMLLEKVEKEWKEIFKGLEREARPLGHENINEYNVEKVAIHVYANNYVQMLSHHVNYVFYKDGKGTIPVADVLDFLCQEMVCGYLNMSPTDLYDELPMKEFVVCKRETYFKVYQTLGKNPDPPKAYEVSKTVERIEQVVSESCHWAHNQHAIIALDDDKAPVSGVGAAKQGIAARKIKKNFNPVIHTMVSVLTSVFLSAHLELVGDTVQDCIDALLLNVMGKTNVERVVLENLTTKDWGYNTREVSNSCRKWGMDELGSCRRERNFKYMYCDVNATSHGQWDIPLTGAAGAYFAIKTCDNGDKLFGCASHRFGRVALATTNLEEYGPFMYHLKASAGNPYEETVAVKNDDASSEDKVNITNEFNSFSIDKITASQ